MAALLFYTGAWQEQKRSVFGSEKRKGKRDLKNPNPNPRRKLGKEEEWVRIWPNPKT